MDRESLHYDDKDCESEGPPSCHDLDLTALVTPPDSLAWFSLKPLLPDSSNTPAKQRPRAILNRGFAETESLTFRGDLLQTELWSHQNQTDLKKLSSGGRELTVQRYLDFVDLIL